MRAYASPDTPQATQYRQDLRDLTALTVTKMDTYHVIGVIFFVLNFT